MARLRSSLIGPAARNLVAVNIHAPSELLKTCDLRIAALDGARSPEAWRGLLAATDFVILVLRAPALLGLVEREFVREHLVPFGLHRIAIVINQIDLVDE
jgi:hypothetical protein